MLNQGKNLLIVEVDGPKDMKTILIDREVLKDKLYNLNDAFGHGYPVTTGTSKRSLHLY